MKTGVLMEAASPDLEKQGFLAYRLDTNIIIQFEHEFHEFAQILMG